MTEAAAGEASAVDAHGATMLSHAKFRQGKFDTDVLAEKIRSIELLDGILSATFVFELLFCGDAGGK